MTSTLVPEPTREVVCPGCGRVRIVSGRHARRVPKTCNLCRHPPKHGAPTDSDRRFWLKLFSDEEIVEIAQAIYEEEGDVEVCHEFRIRLFSRKVTVAA